MNKKIVFKWGLRAAVLAAGIGAAAAFKARNAKIEMLQGELERATKALEAQNRVMKTLQEKLGINIDEGSD